MKQETYETINVTPPKMNSPTRIHQEPKRSIQSEAPRYNLISTGSNDKKNNLPLKTKTSTSVSKPKSTPHICDRMPKGSQNPSSKGGGVSNVRRMSESSKVVGGGTLASAAATLDASVVSAPVEEEGGGTTPDDTPRGRVETILK